MKLWIVTRDTIPDEMGTQYLIQAYVTTERPTDGRLIKSGPFPFFLTLDEFKKVQVGKVYHLYIGEEVREEFEGTVEEKQPDIETEGKSDG